MYSISSMGNEQTSSDAVHFDICYRVEKHVFHTLKWNALVALATSFTKEPSFSKEEDTEQHEKRGGFCSEWLTSLPSNATIDIIIK